MRCVLRAALFACLVAAGVLLSASPVVAQTWDPGAFVELLGAAEQDYVAGNYAAAAGKYGELRDALSGALASGAIDAEQQAAARETLAVIVYQLGRSQQETGECAAAGATFGELERTGDLSEAVRVKLPARLGEAQLCVARTELEAGRLDGAQARLDAAGQVLGTASSAAITAALEPAQASELEGALGKARTELTQLETQYVSARVEAARIAAEGGDCAGAGAHLSALEASHADSPELAPLRETVTDCEPADGSGGGEGDAGSFAEMEPWLAVGVMGLGGALIATAVVLEAVNAGDVDDYEAAHDDCLAGLTGECQKALELSSDIETQQIVTGTLIGVGVAALGGGLAWFLIATSDDGAEVEVAPSASLSGGGVELKVRF